MSSKLLLFTVVLSLLDGAFCARAQSTVFTYQGLLMDGGSPANGQYDLQLNVYDAASNGTVVSGPLLMLFTPVTNGLFTVTPDFGPGVFTGQNLWLDIGVRKSGGNGFTTLTARQQLTSVPYAVFAPSAGTVTGTLALSNLPAGLALLASNQTFLGSVQLTNVNNTVSGNGAGLTNIQVTALSTGGAITPGGAFRPGPWLPTGSQPYAVATGDFNNDGRPDLVSGDFGDGFVALFTNNGAGVFTVASATNIGSVGIFSIAVADLNGDGRLDVVTANEAANSLTILTNNGSNVLIVSTNISGGLFANPYQVVATDINGDGKPDLVVANFGSTSATVLTNNGSGVFAFASFPAVGGAQSGLAVADVNGDGRPDLITANYNNTTLGVLTNKGGGQFASLTNIVVGSGPRAVVAADVNGDGRMDLACVNYNGNTMVVLTNNGSGIFVATSTNSTVSFPNSIIATNTSGGGRPDLIVANAGSYLLSIFTNSGTGGYGLAFWARTGMNPESVVAADFNGDGRPDLAAACAGANQIAVLFDSITLNIGSLAVSGGFSVSSNVIYYPGFGANVGINNANPAVALDVNGVVNATGGFEQVSDSRYKTNVATLADALEKIMALRGVAYDWRRGEFPEMSFNDQRQLGFIAQELATVLPEAVSKDAQGHYSVAYNEVIPVLVEALKEEKNRSDAVAKEQGAKIEELQKEIEALQKMVKGTDQ